MRSIALKSPAKINLYLKVAGKRPDGYHNIETVFEKLSLCDTITLKKKDKGIKIRCSHPKVPLGSKNICYRAIKLLQKEFKQIKGVEIIIKKNIPVAAGLGGGSSNAATVLKAAKKLWDLKLPEKKMLKLAETLGADVPLFIKDWSLARGRGKGERLEEIKTGKKFWHVLVNPGFGVSTKTVYQKVKIKLTTKKHGSNIVICAAKKGDVDSLKRNLYNGLQAIVEDTRPAVKKILARIIQAGEQCPCLSGSGPTIFSVHPSRESALRLHNKLSPVVKGKVVVARTL